ncbi:MAG: DNA polymerase III subunit delta [Acidobacteria bacterium]|nr:DNA polymerase III subunit delta [Acidobacteriota bacterium]
MPSLSKDILREELKRRELRPAYLLYGPETYQRDGAAKFISQQAFGEGDFRDLNETTFSLSTDPEVLREAIAAAEQLPMMSSRRLIKISGVKISQSGIRDTVTEEHESLLRNYLSNPSPSSVVVIVADELNGNRKSSKLLKELCSTVEFELLSDGELLKWATKEFNNLNAEVLPAVVQLLVAKVGGDLHRLNNEIKKLAAAAMPSGVITEELVESLVATSRELDNFAFTKFLVAGKGGKAISTVKKILDDGTEPVVLLGSISFTYRQLLTAKDLMERGLDRRQVVGSLRLRYSDQEPFLAAARRTKLSSLTQAIRDIAKTDIAIKTSLGGSTSGARMQIEMLVAKLALLSSN